MQGNVAKSRQASRASVLGSSPDAETEPSGEARPGLLWLEDGSVFPGESFGFPATIGGEVVFNTGMVGYPETLTDPSYKGQILSLTYPIVGNYGVPERPASAGLDGPFESSAIQISGLLVAEAVPGYSHWSAVSSLAQWLRRERVPALTGIDTRALTKRLREKGTMLGKIVEGVDDVELRDPNLDNLVALVSVEERIVYPAGPTRVVLVDCGCKRNIIRSLLARNLTVIRVPWDYDFLTEPFDGVVISNGPGDPKMCGQTIEHVRRAMDGTRPIFGICLGHQILALAAGADTFKLPFGHRGQNQPCIEVGTSRCYITAQNHGYTVDETTLPDDWTPWFVNANDRTNEGIRHRARPFMSVQFHPEAAPGPVDTGYLFDTFTRMLDERSARKALIHDGR
jgi:carbamoyl-phosphate synthase small subunit